jgi:hypothetical protein
MADLSPEERAQIRSQQCFFRTTSDILGHGRFYSADARFPCSVTVPGTPRFLYHRWDEQYSASRSTSGARRTPLSSARTLTILLAAEITDLSRGPIYSCVQIIRDDLLFLRLGETS